MHNRSSKEYVCFTQKRSIDWWVEFLYSYFTITEERLDILKIRENAAICVLSFSMKIFRLTQQWDYSFALVEDLWRWQSMLKRKHLLECLNRGVFRTESNI